MASHSMLPPQSVADRQRLAALDSYDVLDTLPEEGFDDVVQLAAMTCNTPVALVSLVAEDRQWFKARVGFPQCQTDLSSSVCAFVLDEPDVLVIPDLAADPRTARNPLVAGEPYLGFYAGAPLRNPQGHVMGSLCVIDSEPRPEGLTSGQADALRKLARQVVILLELRRSVAGRDSLIARRRKAEQRIGQDHARLRFSEAHWRGLFERLNEGFVIADVLRGADGRTTGWRHLEVNTAWSEMIGVPPLDIVGRTIGEVMPDAGDCWIADLAHVADTGEPATFTRQIGTQERWLEGRVFPLDKDRFAALFLDVTERVRADIRRNALLEIGDRLRDLATVEDMTRTAAAIVGRALAVSRVGFGRLDAACEYVTVEPDWTMDGIPSIAGRHRLEAYGDIRQELLLGEPLIIRDVLTDRRTAGNPSPMLDAKVRALVNVPIQEHGRTVAVFLVHATEVRAWKPETVAFLRNVADRLTAAVGRRQAENNQELLNQELSHRMKNTLAMVQGIASQVLKGVTEQDAVTGFRQRLQALSSAHDVLLQKNWAAAPLREVVAMVLAATSQAERFTMSGPDVTLGPRATLSLSLVLHELATNAVKYGALSAAIGRVALTWQVEPEAGELVFTWREVDGPPVSEPARQGFGSRLIRSGLIGSGGVTVRYRPTGLEAEMRACLEQVQAA